ncbi:DUF6542 domain-containing protein [Actinomadura rupiterrae]|uniref:DUF6542 domain-containing protein n=1 Tax=Actinomadura rupiterrae TaxID=559627 RepID=UPI0020A293E8|nr:DUF6542 domain-containing protein [Actinomadura rupiterrae]MCP2336683.1 tellurite resistance protein TehA-like permease [Actinomadura rupiterrae]
MRRNASSRRAPRPAAPAGPVTLTGRGGVALVLAAALLGALLARWVGVGMLAGGLFIAGCVLAALLTRPADLPTLVVSPPLACFAATVVAELAADDGPLTRTMSLGLLAALAAIAPWLFAGTLIAVAIAVPRGLPGAFGDLRARLARGRTLAEDDDVDPVRWEEPSRPLPHGDVD